ncbi:MAG: LysR substrate-binding domain-containing protein [Stappiaceae bacterium]
MSIAPIRPKGPPLNAMRAFESAARLESFADAAEELSVTPGAVSQHIKTLEAWVDRPLFQRNAHGVTLTPLGRALLPDFIAAFDALGVATHSLRNERPATEIHIAALPSVAQLWLPERLGRIRNNMPDIKISVTAMETPPNLARELFDLSLFFQEADDEIDQVEIERDVIFPVCSPSMAEKLKTADQLNDIPLLQDQTWEDDWENWCYATGVAIREPKSGPRYSLYSLALEEAKSGAGVLMGHVSLVREALASGNLVQPFEQFCETGRSLILSLPDRRRRNSQTTKVADLLA